MNLVAMARFFKAICYDILENLLVVDSKDRGLFSPVYTSFSIEKPISQGMLHLYCLVWLCGLFHIS